MKLKTLHLYYYISKRYNV